MSVQGAEIVANREVYIERVSNQLREKLREAGFEKFETTSSWGFHVDRVGLRVYWNWRTESPVIQVGPDWMGRRHRKHVYGERAGKGYDWKKLIAYLRERIEGNRTYEEVQARDRAFLEESKCIMEAIAQKHELRGDNGGLGGAWHIRNFGHGDKLRPLFDNQLEISTRTVIGTDGDRVRRYDVRLNVGYLTEAQLDRLLTNLHGVLFSYGLANHNAIKAVEDAAAERKVQS